MGPKNQTTVELTEEGGPTKDAMSAAGNQTTAGEPLGPGVECYTDDSIHTT